MSFAVLAIVKATLVCGAAFVLSRLCRRRRASIRHLLFVLAFTALIAIPIAGLVLPTVAVAVPVTAMAPVSETPNFDSTVLTKPNAEPSHSSLPFVSRDVASIRSLTILQIVAAGWFLGFLFFLIPIIAGLWQVRRLRHSALPWIDGQALVDALAPTVGVYRSIDALVHAGLTGPVTCGVLKTVIILPASAQRWDETALRCAVTHELEHVARWDFLTQCLSRMVCAAYWFHPLVWIAWRRLRLEAERACDDAVLRADDATDYAALLVSIARQEPSGARQPLLAMAGRGDLAARVAAVLDNDQSRGRVSRRWASTLIVAAAIAIISVAPITVARALPQARDAAGPLVASETAFLKRYPSALIRQVDGRMIATNVSLRQLLTFAFGVNEIEKAPWWVEDRFDVTANAPSDITPQGSKLLQALLGERFQLVAHRGSKEVPIYALVVARPDGRLGPQITRSQLDCGSARPTCGMSSAHGRLTGRGVTIAQIEKHLAAQVGMSRLFDRQVVDRTGLTDRFDFTLQWTPDAVPNLLVQSDPPQYRPFTSHLESNAPRFLAALQEQLGLKLDSQLATRPVLIIDRIERPIEN